MLEISLITQKNHKNVRKKGNYLRQKGEEIKNILKVCSLFIEKSFARKTIKFNEIPFKWLEIIWKGFEKLPSRSDLIKKMCKVCGPGKSGALH